MSTILRLHTPPPIHNLANYECKIEAFPKFLVASDEGIPKKFGLFKEKKDSQPTINGVGSKKKLKIDGTRSGLESSVAGRLVLHGREVSSGADINGRPSKLDTFTGAWNRAKNILKQLLQENISADAGNGTESGRWNAKDFRKLETPDEECTADRTVAAIQFGGLTGWGLSDAVDFADHPLGAEAIRIATNSDDPELTPAKVLASDEFRARSKEIGAPEIEEQEHTDPYPKLRRWAADKPKYEKREYYIAQAVHRAAWSLYNQIQKAPTSQKEEALL